MREKTCPCCKKAFNVPDGRKASYCNPCFAMKARVRRLSNPEAFKTAQRRWAEKNRDVVAENNRLYYQRNAESEKARAATWRKANPERVKEQAKRVPKEKKAQQVKRWYDANVEKRAEYRREQHSKTQDRANALARKWKANNKARCTELAMRRQAAKKRAVPAWFDAGKVLAVYEEARRLTALTGAAHHVDHIVPLAGKTASGLHWHGNLQILPAWVNQSKKNKVDPNTPLAVGV